jgi:hypothetical protein
MKYRERLIRTVVTISLSIVVLGGPAYTQSKSSPPDLTGTWVPFRAGRGGDPKLAPPAPTPLAIKPAYLKDYEAKRAADAAAISRGEQLANGAIACMPYGMPSMMSVASYPVEIIQTRKQITMIQEAFSEVRRVYVDKPQLAIDDVPPSYHGRSVGRWDADTLVIDTVGIKESVQYQRIPHTPQMRITERMRLVAPDILHDQITIEDTVTLDKPYTYTLAYRRMPDYEMVEFVCAENNREYVDEQGIVRMRVREK